MSPPEDDVENLEVSLFLEAIHVKYGYDLRGYARASMRRRVLAALARSGLAHLGELQHRVLHNPALFAAVLEDLTVRVTEMFRDPSFYRTFRARVVPLLRTYPFLKIWHAGCASGEEVYASAIMLAEEGLYERAQIYATDLSAQALAQASQGVFPEEQLGAMTAGYIAAGGTASFSDYYTSAYGLIALTSSLRENVLFFQHDLVGDHVFGEMHVVFCRNVLIYFGEELRGRVLGKLSESLCSGGILCLGNSELLSRVDGRHAFEGFAAEERIYRHVS
jgi:chemotaxis protein methyltransferase CheR